MIWDCDLGTLQNYSTSFLENYHTHTFYVYAVFEIYEKPFVFNLKFSLNWENCTLSDHPILQSYESQGNDLLKSTLDDQQPLDNCTKFEGRKITFA